MSTVVSYQSPGGTARVSICRPCEARLEAADLWPRDRYGVELCQVHHGERPGQCDLCEPLQDGEP